MDLQAIIAARPLKTITRDQSQQAETKYLTLPLKTVTPPTDIPAEFKGQEIWEGLINEPLNQGSCGSCWAFATTGTLADRWSILTNGKQAVVLSPVKPILCDWQGEEDSLENPDSPFFEELFWKYNQAGTSAGSCFGNTLSDAWRYLYVSGTTTLSCLPYSLRGEYDTPLNQISEAEKIPLCYDVTGKIGDMCADNVYHSSTGLETGTPAKLYRAGEVYRLNTDPASIQAEIMVNGPVTTGINVYSSFYTFDAVNDVYTHTPGEEMVGGHAVEIVGWGTHPTQGDFWWIKNSWGCYDKYTKILTETGWKFFHELEPEELVATLSETRQLEYCPVEAIHCYEQTPDSPPMHHWNTGGIDLSVTYNHRMLIPTETSYEFKESWEVMDSGITVYRSCENYEGAEWECVYDDSEAYLTILAAFIIGGHKRQEYTSEGIYDPVTSTVDIAGDTEVDSIIRLPKRRKVLPSLKALGIRRVVVSGSVIIVNNNELYQNLPAIGGMIPRYILEWSSEFLRPLFAKIFDGKTEVHVKRGFLAGQLQELAMKSGSACTVKPQRNKYCVEQCDPVASCEPAQLSNYTGLVYCVSVYNRCVFVQRCGKAAWSGNSDWGDKGYFRIKRGTDEAGVESNVMAGLPDFFRPPTGKTKGIEREAEFRRKIDKGQGVAGGGINPATGYSRRTERMQWETPLDTRAVSRQSKYAFKSRKIPTMTATVSESSSNDKWIYISVGIIFTVLWLAVFIWIVTR